MAVLQKFSLTAKLAVALEKFCVNRTVILRIGSIVSKELHYDNGLIQGDSLSAFLYIIFIASISLALNGLSTTTTVNHLAFVDDFLGLEGSQEQTQIILNVIGDICSEIGVVLNLEKCGFISENTDHNFLLAIQNQPLQNVNK